jgi:uncharacterized membrane protein
MLHPKSVWTDQQIDDVIGNLLRTGVALSALVVLLGGILYLTRHGFETLNYRVFRGEPAALRHLSGIFEDALAFRARGLIQSGLLLLILTPIMRVAFSILAFALQRDRTYIVVTLIVFAILLFSLAGGGR